MTIPKFFRYITCYYIVDPQDNVKFIDFYVGLEFGLTAPYKTTDLVRHFAPESWGVHQWGVGIPTPEPAVIQNLDRNWRYGKVRKNALPPLFEEHMPPSIVFDVDTSRTTIMSWVANRPPKDIVVKDITQACVRTHHRDSIVANPSLIPTVGYLQEFVQSKFYRGPIQGETTPERLGVLRSVVALLGQESSLYMAHFPPLVQVASEKFQEATREAKVVSVKQTESYLMAAPADMIDLVKPKNEQILLHFFKYFFSAPLLTIANSRKLFATRNYELSDGSVLAFRRLVQGNPL